MIETDIGDPRFSSMYRLLPLAHPQVEGSGNVVLWGTAFHHFGHPVRAGKLSRWPSGPTVLSPYQSRSRVSVRSSRNGRS